MTTLTQETIHKILLWRVHQNSSISRVHLMFGKINTDRYVTLITFLPKKGIMSKNPQYCGKLTQETIHKFR